ncbi:13247_t:CDS:2 [Ambispora gerdemannii]|uniref:13247_t:CDS:1 n=1 Tax=Ambispora gerdemannii TaxID=144530 RepID=A0A9N9B4I8_9GLOM|nr:13247_t:CDS:2 [Ambispora gerdemannii]
MEEESKKAIEDEIEEEIERNCSKCQKIWNDKMEICLNCELPSWTTGDDIIDDKIKQVQLDAFIFGTDTWFEWIPYDEFSEIKFIAEGGFGSVSSAIWNSGRVCSYDQKARKFIREEATIVALKTLFESNKANPEIIQEIDSTIINRDYASLCRTYGISRDPKTKNYILVLEFYDVALHNISNTEYFDMECLRSLAKGLKSLHYKKFVHRDLHSGAVFKSRSISKIIEKAGVDITSLNNPKKEPNDAYITRQFDDDLTL